jgi:hypothetical protein
MRLSDEQIELLLRGINPNRVGKTPQGFAHVEAWDIRVWLIRVFGFCGWSLTETSSPVCVFERERKLSNGKDGYSVAYRAHLAIVIHLSDGDVTYAGSSIAEASGPNLGDLHDQALKSAESGALKRAATNLGDQFGLSLYNNGSSKPVVLKTVGYTPVKAEADTPTDNQIAATPSAPPPTETLAPAPADVTPSHSAGAGDPVKLRMLKHAVPALDATQKKRLEAWAREKGIKNLMQPDDRVDEVLARCEELQADRG